MSALSTSSTRRLYSNTLLLCSFAILSNLWPNAASANDNRLGYSFYGAGVSLFDYEESSTLSFAGNQVDIETETASIFTLSSGAFVFVNPTWGFYLNTLSTLGVPRSNEEWELSDTVVRRNAVSFEYQRLELLGSYALPFNRTHALFGIQYSNFEYRRFGPSLTDAATDFGIGESVLAAGAVSETLWDVTALIGLEYTSVFSDPSSGWQYQARVLLGTPLIRNIVNTSIANGQAFSENFNGVEFRVSGLIGYRLHHSVVVGSRIELTVVQKDSLNGEVDIGAETTAFPSTTLVSLTPSVSVFWSF